MAWQTPIAAGFDGIIFFVVMVVVIISRLAQAAKKKTPPTQQTRPRIPNAGASAAPEDELRDFLKRLSQGADEVAPPPLPPPAPRRVAPPVPARRQEVPVIPRRAPPAPVASPRPVSKPVLVQSPVPVMAAPAAAAQPLAIVSIPVNKRRDELVAILKNRNSFQEGILLREILGPPLALRRMPWHAYAP